MKNTRILKLSAAVCLAFAASAVQATEPLERTLVPESNSPNAGGNTGLGGHSGVQEIVRSGSRYGIGYEARQGIGAGGHGERGVRFERPERTERVERIEIERGGRGK